MTDRNRRHTDDRAFDAVLFDMDGVVTRTADLHAAAWKELFDQLLQRGIAEGAASFAPFDAEVDYLTYVDGKPRLDGVRSFLAARGLNVPEGDEADSDEAVTVYGLGARKDAIFTRRLRSEGVRVFASTVDLIRLLRANGVKTGVVTSSRNGREVLRAANILSLFDTRVDGIDADALELPGKPDPATFLRATQSLGVVPARTVVIEDAGSGVEAGRRGGFALVVGINRGGNCDALAARGADLVVDDLAEIDIATLASQIRSKRDSFAWTVEQEGFDPAREHDMESIFSVGNGYVGVRGALDTPLPGSQGDLFVAGVYDRKIAERPYSELEFFAADREDYPYSEIVTSPFPFRVGITVDGSPVGLARTRWNEHRRELDLRRALLSSYVEYEIDADRRVVIRTRRCASLADRHLLVQEVIVCLMNHSGVVELSTDTADPDLADNHPHLLPLAGSPEDPTVKLQRFRTRASAVEICVASRVLVGGTATSESCWRRAARLGEPLTLRRFVAVYTSNEVADPMSAAIRHVEGMRWSDFDASIAAHVDCWNTVWKRSSVRIPRSPATEQALRFGSYHLVSAADRDPRVSVAGRALTGRAYEGHIFWDVEIFKFPFYLHTAPDVARNLLWYRYNTLDGARRRARELNCSGACFAWESTVTGDDVTPHTIELKTTGKVIPIFTGRQQLHVTSAVAYAIWRYWQATQDRDLLREIGVEILVETARFWTSRCTRGARHLHIRGVVGPDEYHHSVSDNAYTNWMARFNLERAIAAVEWMKEYFPDDWRTLRLRLDVGLDEPREWATVARDLFCPTPNAQGVIEQFEGFFALEEYPLPREERFKAPISRLFDWDRINRLKLIKQADVLMLPFLFPDAFPAEVVEANYRYYEPMTDHGSSLSPGVHAAIAARVGIRSDAERYWRESLWLDLSNGMGNSALGIHPASMGATWQALVFGFLGVNFTEDGPRCAPNAGARLLPSWSSVELELAWRGSVHSVHVDRERLE